MNDYVLFIDTEASGLPRNWSAPVTDSENWPHAVQVSWIICDANRQIIKKENFYIRNNDFTITADAIRVHGITAEKLAVEGVECRHVLEVLNSHLLQYKPLVVGHFIKLDYYVLSADYHRHSLHNPLNTAPVFCTMLATRYLARNPMPRQMRLDELYQMLFRHDMENPHNALFDAQATMQCFYKLLDEGELNNRLIRDQNKDAAQWRNPENTSGGCMLPVFIALLLCILIYYVI